jgi:AI-2 transport protein TqsA
MLLSVPLTMIIKIALENSAEGSWFAVLLSGEEELEET